MPDVPGALKNATLLGYVDAPDKPAAAKVPGSVGVLPSDGERHPFQAGVIKAVSGLRDGLPYAIEKSGAFGLELTPEEEAAYQERMRTASASSERLLPGGAAGLDDLKQRGVGALGAVIGENLAYSTPQLVAGIAGSVGGGIAGGAAGGAVGSAIPVVGTVTGAAVGTVAGAIGGGTAVSTPFFVGSNVDRATSGGTDLLTTGEAQRSLAVAPLQAAADTLVDRFLPGVGKMLPGPAVTGGIVRRALTNTAGAAATEAVTEAGQQVGERYAAGLDLGSREAMGEYGESAAIGGITGGAIGAASSPFRSDNAKGVDRPLDTPLVQPDTPTDMLALPSPDQFAKPTGVDPILVAPDGTALTEDQRLMQAQASKAWSPIPPRAAKLDQLNQLAQPGEQQEMFLPDEAPPRPATGRMTLTGAIRRVETGRNPAQRSEAGALGAMQLLPETAQAMAKNLGVEYDQDRLLNDPEYNEALGSEYLRVLTDQYAGDQFLAVTAYHAGPGNVQKWIKEFGRPTDGASREKWLDQIEAAGYPRSAAYPRKVMANLGQDLDGGVVSQGGVLARLRGAMADDTGAPAKADSGMIKLAGTISDSFGKNDPAPAEAALTKASERLDKALTELADEQAQIDEGKAKGEHSEEEQARYQAAMDKKLAKLQRQQNMIAEARSLTDGYFKVAEQPALQFTPPPAPPASMEPQPLQSRPFGEPVPATPNMDRAFEVATEVGQQSIVAQTQPQRTAILEQVLADPGTRRPMQRYLAELKRAGFNGELRQDEAERIAKFEEVRDAFTSDQPDPRVVDASPDESGGFGIPERAAPAAPAAPVAEEPAPAAEPEPAPEPAAPADNGVANVRARAAAQADSLGSTKRAWFLKGSQSVTDPDVFEVPAAMGRTQQQAFDEGKAYAERELGQQQAEGKAAPAAEPKAAAPKAAKRPTLPKDKPAPKQAATSKPDAASVTPEDVEALKTRIEYMLDAKDITAKQAQQLSIAAEAAERGDIPVADVDAMLDTAAEQRAAQRQRAFGPKAAERRVRATPAASAQRQRAFGPKAAERRVWATPAASARDDMSDVAAQLRKALDRLGMHDVGLQIATKVEMALAFSSSTAGVYDSVRKIISVAYDFETDPTATLHHEAIHAMRVLGLLTPTEWRALETAVDKGDFGAWARDAYPELEPEAQIEEGVAEMFAEWAAASTKRPITMGAVKVLTKLRTALRAIARVFKAKGLETFADTLEAFKVFEDIAAGKIGARPRADTAPRAGPSERRVGPNSLAKQDLKSRVKADVKDVLAQLHLGIAQTEDVANIAREHLPSALAFIELQSRGHALARKFEDRLSDIKRRYEKVDAKFKGIGPGSVNRLLYDMRIQSKWAFKPTHRPNIKVDATLAAQFAKLPASAQEIVRAVIQFNADARQMLLRLTVSVVNAAYDPAIAEAQTKGDPDRVKELKLAKDVALKHFSRLHAAAEDLPYSPLKRGGKFVVIGMSPEYVAAKTDGDVAKMNELRGDGDHYFVDYRPTKGEAEALAERLGTKFKTAQAFERDSVTDLDIGGQELFQAFGAIMDKARTQLADDPTDEASKRLYRLTTDMYLHVLADTSARKAELKADLVSALDPVTGEAVDMMRAFVDRGTATTHFVAALSNSSELRKAIDDMRAEAADTKPGRDVRERLRNQLMWHYNHTLHMSASPLTDAITHGVSIWTLLLKPAYHIVNASQPVVISLPALAGRVGYVKAAAAMTRAYQDIGPVLAKAGVTDRMDYTAVPADVKTLVQELVERGRIDTGQARGLSKWELEGSGAAVKAFNTADRVIRFAGQNVESVNRLVTGIAAYRAMVAQGSSPQRATEVASKLIYDTHGDHSEFNSPRVITGLGNFGRVFLQYRKFQLIMLSHMAKLVYNSMKGATPEEKFVARKALGFTLAHAGLVGGAIGLPAANAMGATMGALLSALDPDDDDQFKDWDQDLEASLTRITGNAFMAKLLYRGLPYAMGVDVSEQAGLGGIASIAPYTDLKQATADRDGYFKAIGQIMAGAFGGVGARAISGLGFAADGDYARAIEQMLPNGLSDLLEANRISTRGVQKTNGDTLLAPADIEAAAPILTGLGFKPSQLADQSRDRSRAFKAEEHYKGKTTRIKRRYTQAAKAKDTAELAAIRKEWADLQAARKADGFKVQPLSTLIKAPREQAKREARTVDGVQYSAASKGFVEKLNPGD